MPVYKHNVLKWRKTNKFSIGCLICAVPCLMDRKIYNFIGAFLGHGGILGLYDQCPGEEKKNAYDF